VTATTASHRSRLPASAEGLAQSVRAEWTKFRTVRGWVTLAVIAGLMIVLLAYLATFHQEVRVCTGTSPASQSCGPANPHVPLGPNGEPVSDTYYFVHRTLTGDGTITARVGPLAGWTQTGNGNGLRGCQAAPGNRPPAGTTGCVDEPTGAPAAAQPWSKAGLLMRANVRPGSAYAAVMLTGAHGVRMQSDYTDDAAGPAVPSRSARWLRLTRSGQTLTGYESADGLHWQRVDSVHLSGLPQIVQAGLFVTSPETAPMSSTLAPRTTSRPTSATARFDQLRLEGGWSSRGWSAEEVGDTGMYPTLSSVGSRHSGGVFTVTGSGDIAPAVGVGDSDWQALTGVFVGLIALIVLGAIFITSEYRRGLIHTTLAASPRRGRVLVAKALVIAGVAFVAAAVAAAISIPLGSHLLRVNGNYVYPMGTLTQLRVILGTGALVALAAVLALALGAVLRRGAGAVTASVGLIILPYVLATFSALPAGASQWLMRLTPAAGFAIEQAVPQYRQVNYPYTPTQGFYPLSPAAGLAVLLAYTLIALLVANRLLQTRDA